MNAGSEKEEASEPAPRSGPSLGRRIAISMVAVTAFATCAAGIAAWFTTRGILIATIDQSLHERAAGLTRGGIPDGLLSGRFTPPSRPDGPDAFLLVRENGLEIFRSEGLPAGGAVAELKLGPDIIAPSTLADDTPVRVCSVQATVRTRRSWRETPGTADEPTRIVEVLVLHSTADMQANLRQLAWVLGGLWLLACALAGIAAWSTRRGILRPVARLVHAIDAINPATLHPRPVIADAPAEMAGVVQRLDSLLARVDTVLSREKATIGAIAHELRTPVAGLRTTLEFASARTADADAQATYAICLEVIIGLQQQVETLLRLTRLEAGAEILVTAPCDVVGLLRDTWTALAQRTTERALSCTWHLPEELTIVTGVEALRTIVLNVLGNAAEHAPDHSLVNVHLAGTGEHWELRISNQTDLAEVSRVFEPFWRADPARSAGHSGLGLALAQRLARLLSLTLSASIQEHQFCVVLSQGVVSPDV